jgi:hypothetical protein
MRRSKSFLFPTKYFSQHIFPKCVPRCDCATLKQCYICNVDVWCEIWRRRRHPCKSTTPQAYITANQTNILSTLLTHDIKQVNQRSLCNVSSQCTHANNVDNIHCVEHADAFLENSSKPVNGDDRGLKLHSSHHKQCRRHVRHVFATHE